MLIYHRFDAFLCNISSRKIHWHNKYTKFIPVKSHGYIRWLLWPLIIPISSTVTACFFKTRGSESCHYHKVVQADLTIPVTVYRRSNASVSISYCSLTRIPCIVRKLTRTEFIISTHEALLRWLLLGKNSWWKVESLASTVLAFNNTNIHSASFWSQCHSLLLSYAVQDCSVYRFHG